MIRFEVLVSHLTFGDFEILGDIILFNVYVKNGFFESCFQQSAKGKMTAQTCRKHNFSVNISLYDGIVIKK